jgi:carbamate kinase
MVEVDRDDPGFKNPTKFIGPVYSDVDADRLKAEKGWAMKKDGNTWRRVVASPQPKRIFEVRPIRWLLEKGTIVIAAGGGGIPTVYEPGRKLGGIEAVIDKDLCSELLARQIEADFFIMATDVDAVYVDWGKPTARAIRRAHPKAMRDFNFPAGSMGPKVEAAIHFAEVAGKNAAIGALKDLPAILRGEAGSTIAAAASAVEWSPAKSAG